KAKSWSASPTVSCMYWGSNSLSSSHIFLPTEAEESLLPLFFHRSLCYLSSMKKYGAEALGTFALVFAGTGAIVINETTGGAIGHSGIALTFGLVVLAMIYTVGDISGAHLNPAVTIGFWAARRLPARAVWFYVASQCLGATMASLLLRFLFPQNATLGITTPSGSVPQSFILE